MLDLIWILFVQTRTIETIVHCFLVSGLVDDLESFALTTKFSLGMDTIRVPVTSLPNVNGRQLQLGLNGVDGARDITQLKGSFREQFLARGTWSVIDSFRNSCKKYLKFI